MSEYSVLEIMKSMIEDPFFYFMLLGVLLLLFLKNFWVSVSAIGLFVYCEPFFLTVLVLPFIYKENSGIGINEFVDQVVNGFAAAGILMIIFGFYKLVTNFEKHQSRAG